jgi:hypothetical protein
VAFWRAMLVTSMRAGVPRPRVCLDGPHHRHHVINAVSLVTGVFEELADPGEQCAPLRSAHDPDASTDFSPGT